MSILQLISWLMGSAAVGLGVFLVFSGWLSDWLAGNRRQPRCRKCWYPMTVPGQLVCPECGWNAPDEAAKHRSRRVRSRIVLGVLLLLLGAGGTLWPMITLPGVTAGLPLSWRLVTHRYLKTEPQLFLLLRPVNLTLEECHAAEQAAMESIRRAGYSQRLISNELSYLEQLQFAQSIEWLPCWAELLEHGDPGTQSWVITILLGHRGTLPPAASAPAPLREAIKTLKGTRNNFEYGLLNLMFSTDTNLQAEVAKAIAARARSDELVALIHRGPEGIAAIVAVFERAPNENKDSAAQTIAAALDNYQRESSSRNPTPSPATQKLFLPLIAPTLALCDKGWPPTGNGVMSLVTQLSKCTDPGDLAAAMAQKVRDASATECARIARAFDRLEPLPEQSHAWEPYIAAWFDKLESEDSAREACSVLARLPETLRPLVLPGAQRALTSPNPWARYCAIELYQRAIWYKQPLPIEPLEAIIRNPKELPGIRMRALYELGEVNSAHGLNAKPWEVHLDP